jgi:hypothetical protein
MAKANGNPDEFVIRIKNTRLRQRLEDEARRTGRTPEIVVNEVFQDLRMSRRTIELYMMQVAQLNREIEEQHRQRQEEYRQIKEAWEAHQRRDEEFEAQLCRHHEEAMQLLEAFVNTTWSWRASAEKAVALCKKFEVKTRYLEKVRRQRDELLGLVERMIAGKKVHPDEVGTVYAIAEKALIDRMIDRIEIAPPPDIAPFDPGPPPPAA